MKTNKKLIALFVVCLIIALPVSTAGAFADYLSVNRYSGSNGLNGYSKKYDQWLINATASITGDSEITPNQLKIGDNEFQQCSVTPAGNYECEYVTGLTSMIPGSWPITVKLYDDSGAEKLTDSSKTITVDANIPKISFPSLPVQNGQNIALNYRVEDTACNASSCAGKCSGINRIEFFDGAALLRQLNVSGCIYENSITFPIPSSGSITVYAYDNLNAEPGVAANPSFGLDVSAPSVDVNSFRIMDSEGNELTGYIGSSNFMATIGIDINEPNFDGLKIKADFSELGLSANISPDICYNQTHVNKCEWKNLNMNIPQAGAFAVRISAEDAFGNSAGPFVISKILSIDNTAPQSTFIGTAYVPPYRTEGTEFGKYLGEGKNNIIIKMTETESGFTKENVYIDFSRAGIGGTVKANNCYQASGEWLCIWGNVSTSKSDGESAKLYLVSSFDDVGNSVIGVLEETLTVDKKKPEVIGNISLVAIPADGSAPVSYFKSGDTLFITANVTDRSGVQAYADLSRVKYGQGNDKVLGTCAADENNITLCTWRVDGIASGEPDGYSADFNLTFYDAALNKQTIGKTIEIYGLEVEENPDYWSVGDITHIPPAIDRGTAPLINQRMFFKIPLVTNRGVSTLAIYLDANACGGSDVSYIERAGILNNQRESTTPFVWLELKTIDPNTLKNLNQLNVNCSLGIVSLKGNKVTNVEHELVSVAIPFYNMPLGEASKELQDKIEDEKDKWIMEWGKFIEPLNKLLHYSEMLCNIIYTWRKLVGVFYAIKAKIGHAEIAAGAPGYAILHPVRVGTCRTTEGIRATADTARNGWDKFCEFINCKLNTEGPVGGPPMDTWYTKFMKNLGGRESWLDNLGAQSVFEMVAGPETGSTGTEEFSRIAGPAHFNRKNSLILSLWPPCLAGIIYNLEKYRQLQCMYIDCLQNAATTGAPADACDMVKSYSECKYIFGEIFQVVSFFWGFDYYFNLIRNALANPGSIISFAVAYACMPWCEAPTDWPHTGCAGFKIMSELLDAVANIEALEEKWSLKEDYCDKVD